jgi:hypothetical protein
MRPTYATRTQAKYLPAKDFCQQPANLPAILTCGDLDIRPLSEIPLQAIRRKNAIFFDIDCGSYYTFRGAHIFETPGCTGVIALVLDRAIIVPPDHLVFPLERGLWKITPTTNGQEGGYDA